MPDLSDAVQYAVWQVPQASWRIEYDPAVLEDIRSAVVDAFFSVPRGGAEIGGVLFGLREADCVRVLDFRALECEHASGPSFVLSERDHARLTDLLARAAGDPRLAGFRPVGWYHSHTRSEILLSEEDQEIHRRYFPEPWQIALVVKPHTYRPAQAGFFVRSRDGVLRSDRSYREFPLQPQPGRAPRDSEPLTTPLPEAPALAVAPALEPPPEAQPAPAPEPVPLPAFLSAEPRRRRALWPLLLAAGLAGGAAGGYAARGAWLPLLRASAPAPAPPPIVDLTAVDLNGQLVVRWDRSAPSVGQASGGTLELTDGAASAALVLSPEQLRTGTFTYARQTGRVDVRLTVRDRSGNTPVRAFTSFLGQPPAAPPSAPPDARLVTSDQQLAARVRFLEQRNRELDRTVQDLHRVIRLQQDRLSLEAGKPVRSRP